MAAGVALYAGIVGQADVRRGDVERRRLWEDVDALHDFERGDGEAAVGQKDEQPEHAYAVASGEDLREGLEVAKKVSDEEEKEEVDRRNVSPGQALERCQVAG